MEELKPYICENGINYKLIGDYYFPMISFPCESRPIGRWGRMHLAYLEEHKPSLHTQLMLDGTLCTYLADLNEQAEEQLETIMAGLVKQEGITEQLKAEHQMEWVGRMNEARHRAEECILAELVYV